MKKFVVIYRTPAEAMKEVADVSPEEFQEGMKPWMAWAERCGSGLVDLGTPLMNGQKVQVEGATSSSSDVTGYSILQAENMEGALAMLEDHPHLGWTGGCKIEVFEQMPLPI